MSSALDTHLQIVKSHQKLTIYIVQSNLCLVSVLEECTDCSPNLTQMLGA